MQHTDLMDTQPEAYRRLLKRLRELTPEERLQMVIDRVVFGREIHRLATQRIEEARRFNPAGFVSQRMKDGLE